MSTMWFKQMSFRVVAVASGILLGGAITTGAVWAGSHKQAIKSEPPEVIHVDATVGGAPADSIEVTYLPGGFKQVDETVETLPDGAQLHSQKYTGDSGSFDVYALRRPEPLDRGSDLGYETDVTTISVSGHDALLLTPANGNEEAAVIEWQVGPTIVKVLGDQVSIEELTKVARGLTVASTS